MRAPPENKEECSGLLDNFDSTSEEPDTILSADTTPRPKSYRRLFFMVTPLLFLSLTINIFIFANFASNCNSYQNASKYADLRRTHTEPYVLLTDYSSSNTTLADDLWHSINIDNGVVALSDSFAASRNLRTAQRFPWDTTKGIYILHGFHNLHCLKIIYISLFEFRNNKSQSRSWHHIAHCLDALRRQILCDADDTPRATERRAEVVSGVGQNRVCRDWGELEQWAQTHTACYKRPERPDDETGLRRFMHCPPDSGYVVDEGYVPTDEILVGLPEESISTSGTEKI